MKQTLTNRITLDEGVIKQIAQVVYYEMLANVQNDAAAEVSVDRVNDVSTNQITEEYYSEL